MFELYTFATPNNIKVLIALEELGLGYHLNVINIRKGEQKSPAFLALNPNGKLPVLVDRDDSSWQALTESAAILIYLAEREGKLLPASGIARARVFEQLFFHGTGVGPAFGNAGYFLKLADTPNPEAIKRFHTEAKRTLAILDVLLAKKPFIAGDEYSIADIAHFGWLWRRSFADIDFSEAPHVERWYQTMEQRPAVQRAIARCNEMTAA